MNYVKNGCSRHPRLFLASRWRTLLAYCLLHLRDTTLLDRWLWVRGRISPLRRGRLLDVGCGAGAMAINASLLGFQTVGVTDVPGDVEKARRRARRCGAVGAQFSVLDIRRLDESSGFASMFDVVLCCEVIEHVTDDAGLMRAMGRCLRPGGHLLLTTPFREARPISTEDRGPFPRPEDGGHVRRGYSGTQLAALCESSGLRLVTTATCTGPLSQVLTGLWQRMSMCSMPLASAAITPFRWCPPSFDRRLGTLMGRPDYSICVDATRDIGGSGAAGPKSG